MTRSSPADEVALSAAESIMALDRVTQLCLALPETEREISGRHAAFTVRKKKFAYFLDDHHGDGIVSVCVRVGLGANEDIARPDPARYYIPAYIGHRGWLAVRLDVDGVDWDEVETMIRDSYLMAAPVSLRRSVSSA